MSYQNVNLREIAQNKVSLYNIKTELVKSFQKNLSLLEEFEENSKNKE